MPRLPLLSSTRLRLAMLSLLIFIPALAMGQSSPTLPAVPGPSPVLSEPVGDPAVGDREGMPAESQPDFYSIPAGEYEEILRRLDGLEEKAEEKAEKKAADKSEKEKEAPFGKEKWSIKLGGQVMGDYVSWMQADPAIPNTEDLINIRRIRLNLDATGFSIYDFRVQFDVEPDNDLANGVTQPYVAMKDLFIGIKEMPFNGKFRAGNFFVPFSLDQLSPLPVTTFMERSIPSGTVFTPTRELGFASYHISHDKNKTLALGFFVDELPESTKEINDDNQGYRFSGRSTWLPYYDEASEGRSMLHTGLGVLHTEDRDQSIRFRTSAGEIRETTRLLDTGNIAADSYTIYNLELATISGPLSFQSELFATQVHRLAAEDVTLAGAYVQSSFFLTGENRKYERDGMHLAHFGRVVPRSTFSLSPKCIGWGAWEAKMRWSYLDFDPLNRGQYNDLTLGMNWYWHEHARMMFEWIHPWTSRDALFGETQSDMLAMRMQFTF